MFLFCSRIFKRTLEHSKPIRLVAGCRALQAQGSLLAQTIPWFCDPFLCLSQSFPLLQTLPQYSKIRQQLWFGTARAQRHQIPIWDLLHGRGGWEPAESGQQEVTRGPGRPPWLWQRPGCSQAAVYLLWSLRVPCVHACGDCLQRDSALSGL